MEEKKSPRNRVWGYADSDQAETWSGDYDTREEAVAAGRRDLDGDVWVVEGERFSYRELFTQCLDIEGIAQDLQEKALDAGIAHQGMEGSLFLTRDDVSSVEVERALVRAMTLWANLYFKKPEGWVTTSPPECVRLVVGKRS